MTSRPPAPPLPKPQHPAVAAQALAEAAYAAAHAWAQPLEPDSHNRAISQLYSTLRDLGIATRGLARYQTAGASPDPAPRDFPRHVTASARWLLSACESLDGVLAAEGISPLPDPDEPGAALCRAARNAIVAWRQPSGTSGDRDTTVRAVHHSHRVPLLRHAGPCGLRATPPRHRPSSRRRQPRRSHRLPDRGHPGTRRKCRARRCRGTGRVPRRRGMSGNTANSAGAISGRKKRPGPDAHGGDATTLAIAGFPQPALGPAGAATRQPAAQASPARLRVPARRPGTYGVLL